MLKLILQSLYRVRVKSIKALYKNEKAPQKPPIKKLKGIQIANEDIFYFPIPKTACTSIKNELYRLIENKVYLPEEYNGHHIHAYFDGKMVNNTNFSHKVIVVRDPIKRFLSAFSNRVKFHCELHEKAIKKNNPHLVDKLPKYNPYLPDFIKYLEDYLLVSSIEHHCRPISVWINNDISQFTDIIPIENLTVLEKRLSNCFDEKVVFPREQTGGPKIGLQRLNRAQLDKLLSYYHDDYILLKDFYSPETIIKEWQDAKRTHRNQNQK